MERSNKSPVMGYKIAIVNNANMQTQFVNVPGSGREEVRDAESGEIVTPGIPEKQVKQFEYASKRLSRAIRKARKLAQAGNRSIMLFCVRENGEHFPINYRKSQYELKNEPANAGARFALKLAMPGTPIEDQKTAMGLYRTSFGNGPLPDDIVDRYYRPKKEA
jgi:DNA-binding protein